MTTLRIACWAELPLHEGVPIERTRRSAIDSLLNFASQCLDAIIIGDIAPHRFAHDFAGRREFARFDLAAGELNEGVAQSDRGVLCCHEAMFPNFGIAVKRGSGRSEEHKAELQ